MADVTCPECDEPIALKKQSSRVKCPACGTSVPVPENLRAEPEEAKQPAKLKPAPRETAEADKDDKPTGGKIKQGSKPRKRRDDDDDDYDHDHPRRRQPRQSGSDAGPIVAIILAVVVVVGIVIGIVSALSSSRDKPNTPQAAGPNFNAPGLNAAPGWQGSTDTSAAEDTLPPVTPPFEVDPLLEQPPRPVYLADMKEFGVRMGPWRLGKGQLGDPQNMPLVIQGRPAPKGLGVSPWDKAATRVAYALGGKAVTLSGRVALNDASIETYAPVVFKIVGDGQELWKSRPTTRAGGPTAFKVDVRGVQVLELRVIALGAHNAAHAVWVDPIIEK